MRVLFVFQSFSNLGIEYLSAVLKRHGHTTDLAFDPALFDDAFLNNPRLARWLSHLPELVQQAEEFQPDLIAFNVMTPFYGWARRLATALKSATHAPVVFGGLHASGTPDTVIQDPAVDYVIVGEGEHPLLKLVEAIENGSDLSTVPNLVWRRDGVAVKNPLGPFPSLDSLPWPDKELFARYAPESRYGYTIITGRGCPMRCTFCCESLSAKLSEHGDRGFLRRRAVDDVIAELVEAQKQHPFDHVRFYDDILTWDREWFGHFAEEYAAKIRLPYWCFTYPGQPTPETVKLMKRSGCYEVQMGVQSVAERTRRTVMNRRETNEQVAETIALFKGSGISLAVDNILGVPGQTREEILEMVNFYREHSPSRVNAYWLTYYPGTTIIPIAMQSGDLDEQKLQELYHEPMQTAFHINRPAGQRELHQLHNYVLFALWIPKKCHQWIQRWRLYRFFPAFDALAIIGLAYRFRSVRSFPHLETRIYGRYRRGILGKILSKVGLRRRPTPNAEIIEARAGVLSLTEPRK